MAARSDASSRRRSQDESSYASDREIYFHIVKQQKVRVVNSTNTQLPALRYAQLQRDCSYYTTECTRNSRPNQEHCIRSDVIKRVKDILRPQVETRKSDPSTLGFTFQARFGNMHFIIERQQRQEDIPTDRLKEKPAVFYFGIQFDARHFIQGQCVERAVETDVRYKLTFTATTGNNEVVCTCHAKENDDGSFELVWARAPTSVTEGPPSKEMIRFDIVRPAASRTQVHKRVDVRIVGCPETQPVSDSDEVYRIAEEITSNMTRHAGVLSMYVLGATFRVTFIRRKSMQTYTWKENPGWKIVDCVAYNCPDFENNLEIEQDVPYDVNFEDEPRKEIYFQSAIYYTKPTGDPDVTLSTSDEYLSHLEEFVGASFHMAEMLEDTI